MPPADLSVVEVDIHSHLIPAIDDGARKIDETLELAAAFVDLGYRKVITTPHVKSADFPNTEEGILTGLREVQEACRQEAIPLEIEAAAEYYLDHEFLKKIENRDLLTFGSHHVLFELPFIGEPPILDEVVVLLQAADYRPVLAHPERYEFWHHSFGRYRELHEMGVILQLNMNSLTEYYSRKTREIAECMIAEGLVRLLGSDCHHSDHVRVMNDARHSRALYRLLGSGCLLNPGL